MNKATKMLELAKQVLADKAPPSSEEEARKIQKAKKQAHKYFDELMIKVEKGVRKQPKRRIKRARNKLQEPDPLYKDAPLIVGWGDKRRASWAKTHLPFKCPIDSSWYYLAELCKEEGFYVLIGTSISSFDELGDPTVEFWIVW